MLAKFYSTIFISLVNLCSIFTHKQLAYPLYPMELKENIPFLMSVAANHIAFSTFIREQDRNSVDLNTFIQFFGLALFSMII